MHVVLCHGSITGQIFTRIMKLYMYFDLYANNLFIKIWMLNQAKKKEEIGRASYLNMQHSINNMEHSTIINLSTKLCEMYLAKCTSVKLVQ